MSTLADQPDGRPQMPSTMANVKHLPENGGRAFAILGNSISFKAEPEDTDDALFLFEHRMPPTLGVPAHTEHNYEAFYVLEGTLEVEADGERYRLGPGEFLGMRPGVVHSLHNPGPGMMRILTLVSPGSQHARFFSTLGSTLGEPIEDPSKSPPQLSGPPDIEDIERMAAVGHECGIEFLPPPEPNDREQA
jgi:quercetin dioxygenase-like cupin family protein